MELQVLESYIESIAIPLFLLRISFVFLFDFKQFLNLPIPGLISPVYIFLRKFNIFGFHIYKYKKGQLSN